MAKLDTFIKISVDGKAAISELGQVESAVDDVDQATEDAGTGGMSNLNAGAAALSAKMRDIAGPAAVGAVVTGMVAAVEKTIELGIQADTIATALDITTEEASRLAAAFGDVGIEANDIVDIGLQIQGGLEDNTDLTDRLGVVMEDLKSPVDAIRVGIDNWDLLKPTERATLFGEEGVRQISRMVAEGQTLDQILAGVADIRVISEADAERARKMAASMAELKGLVEGVTLVVGGNLLEAFENVQAVADLLPGNLDSATIAAEAFSAALSPPLFVLGKIDDAVKLVAKTFLGELDPAAQTVADSVLGAFDTIEQNATAALGEVDAAFDDTATAGEDAASRVSGAWDLYSAKLDADTALARLRLKFRDTFDEAYEGNKETEEGLLRNQVAVNDLTTDVGDYLTAILKIPEDKATEMVLEWGALTPEQVEAELVKLSRRRTIELLFRVPTATPPIGVLAPTANSSTVNNVTINGSRSLSPRETAQIAADWTRVNG